jgi:hypothetical protein
MYVQTNMIMTSSTTPRVMQVVPFPLLETLDKFFLDDRVPARFSELISFVL